jgi:GAF domain-containing protein
VTREQRLAHTFVDLADSLVDRFDVVDLLTLLTERCVELLDASAAGLLLGDATGALRLMAATSEAMEVVELFQVQNDEGPCRDCYRSGAVVAVPDLAEAAARWPRFVPVALDSGFRSVHALPLRLRREVLGALGLFGASPGELPADEKAVAQALADVATIALLQHRAIDDAQLLAEQLHVALNSRVAIEQAKGVIAERLGIRMDEAFGLLRGYARARQRLLADVAGDVAEGRLGAEALMSPPPVS